MVGTEPHMGQVLRLGSVALAHLVPSPKTAKSWSNACSQDETGTHLVSVTREWKMS